MSERAESGSYWQRDLSLGEIELEDASFALSMRLYRSRESYQERRELVPLEVSSGERTYLHATPYLLIPEVQLMVDIDPSPRAITSNGNGASAPSDRAIGEVIMLEMQRPRAQEVGNCQGWCYPAERLIVYWEALLFDWCRAEEPLTDLLLDRIWTGLRRIARRDAVRGRAYREPILGVALSARKLAGLSGSAGLWSYQRPDLQQVTQLT